MWTTMVANLKHQADDLKKEARREEGCRPVKRHLALQVGKALLENAIIEVAKLRCLSVDREAGPEEGNLTAHAHPRAAHGVRQALKLRTIDQCRVVPFHVPEVELELPLDHSEAAIARIQFLPAFERCQRRLTVDVLAHEQCLEPGDIVCIGREKRASLKDETEYRQEEESLHVHGLCRMPLLWITPGAQPRGPRRGGSRRLFGPAARVGFRGLLN